VDIPLFKFSNFGIRRKSLLYCWKQGVKVLYVTENCPHTSCDRATYFEWGMALGGIALLWHGVHFGVGAFIAMNTLAQARISLGTTHQP
jgi:hypothetical protein